MTTNIIIDCKGIDITTVFISIYNEAIIYEKHKSRDVRSL